MYECELNSLQCLRIHREVSLSRGAGRMYGVSLYARKRLSRTLCSSFSHGGQGETRQPGVSLYTRNRLSFSLLISHVIMLMSSTQISWSAVASAYGLLNSAQHVINRILNPHFLS